jgi:hypothetical protein
MSVSAEFDSCQTNSDCQSSETCTEGHCEDENPSTNLTRSCEKNEDCEPSERCGVENECYNPCDFRKCKENSECVLVNGRAVCDCSKGYFRNSHYKCQKFNETSPCNDPSICGPHSKCIADENGSYCECLPGFVNLPPNCRSSCKTHEDCEPSETCHHNECADPCHGIGCVVNAECVVVNRESKCECKKGFYKDFDKDCQKFNEISPCDPNPCGGPKTKCIDNHDESGPYCECLPGLVSLPFCRRTCETNDDCEGKEVCTYENECFDPCLKPKFDCPENAEYASDSHGFELCVCKEGYFGSPDVKCSTNENDPCFECGRNAKCVESGSDAPAECSCLPGFDGQPPYCTQLIVEPW